MLGFKQPKPMSESDIDDILDREFLTDFDTDFDSIGLSISRNDTELGYIDPSVTWQQKKRDKSITELLEKYVEAYSNKVRHSKVCRYVILLPCIAIIVAFAVILMMLAVKTVSTKGAIGTKRRNMAALCL